MSVEGNPQPTLNRGLRSGANHRISVWLNSLYPFFIHLVMKIRRQELRLTFEFLAKEASFLTGFDA